MPESLSSDLKDLLLRTSRGDEGAFRVLYDQNKKAVYFLARKLLKSEKEAKDVLQEIFLRLWLKRAKLAEVEHFPAYLNTLARNYIYNRLRVKAIQEVYLPEMNEEEEKHSGQTPFESLSLRQLEQVLHDAVQELSPQQKKVFELSRVEGYKHDEIAEQLSISKETVKKHVMEALRSIKSKLKQNGISFSLLLLARILLP